jgi:hypothetical protein
MRAMAQLLQQRRPPSDVMALIASGDDKRGPYQSCPCGSGQKFRFCHGNNAPISPFSSVNPATATCQDALLLAMQASSLSPISHAAEDGAAN